MILERSESEHSTSPTGGLGRLLEERRVVVCVGSGGVGKTTMAAALALAGAREGKRTLCLTIDPARRLAQSLGLEELTTDEVRVSSAWMQERGIELRGELTVMMLDAGRTFDELIARYAPNQEVLAAIQGNRIYRHLSRSLAGTQSYMAMEKVQAVARENRFDLIVLDTPPSERALDFFDAPDRMRDVIDSPATRVLAKAMQPGGLFSLRLVNQGVRGLLRGMSKITGGALIEELSQLLSMLNGLFGGFAERAESVGRQMKSPDFGYVLITAPRSLTLTQAKELSRALAERGIFMDALVLNQMTPAPGVALSRAALLGQKDFLAFSGSEQDADQMLEAFRIQGEEAARDRQLIEELWGNEGSASLKFPVRVEVPSFTESVHEPERLLEIAEILLGESST